MIAKKDLFMILIGRDVPMSTSVQAVTLSVTVFAQKRKNVQILKVYFLKSLLYRFRVFDNQIKIAF